MIKITYLLLKILNNNGIIINLLGMHSKPAPDFLGKTVTMDSDITLKY